MYISTSISIYLYTYIHIYIYERMPFKVGDHRGPGIRFMFKPGRSEADPFHSEAEPTPIRPNANPIPSDPIRSRSDPIRSPSDPIPYQSALIQSRSGPIRAEPSQSRAGQGAARILCPTGVELTFGCHLPLKRLLTGFPKRSRRGAEAEPS